MYLEEIFVVFVKGSFRIQKKPVLCIEQIYFAFRQPVFCIFDQIVLFQDYIFISFVFCVCSAVYVLFSETEYNLTLRTGILAGNRKYLRKGMLLVKLDTRMR